MRITFATLAMIGLLMSNIVMAAGDPAAGEAKAATCAACHGADGNSVVPTFPKLAGQSEAYLYKQLQDYASEKRAGPIMSGVVATLSEQDMADLAAYYAQQDFQPNTGDVAEYKLGQMLYRAGNKETGVPACMACHGPHGHGVPASAWPALAGQHEAYMLKAMTEFANGTRNNDVNDMMRDIAGKMTEAEMQAVSAYIHHALN